MNDEWNIEQGVEYRTRNKEFRMTKGVNFIIQYSLFLVRYSIHHS